MALADARIFHVNVNCRDLAVSRAFYEALALDALAHAAPGAPQSGTAFGLEAALWDAWILCGRHGFDGGAVDLLEWQEPTPAGAPPTTLYECGYQRIGVLVGDLDRALERVAAHSSVMPTVLTHTNDDGSTNRLAIVRDPDGTAVELVEIAALDGTGAQLSFVSVTCRDVDVSLAFYDRLGFREVARYTSEHDDGSHLGIAGPLAMDEVVMRAPGGGEVLFMLVGFRTPATRPAEPRPANALGIWRTAFLLDDVDRVAADLRANRIDLVSDPVAMEMGEGLPQLRFFCFRGPDGEVIECIEQPKVYAVA
jgi:catechol 2,3-dioxygenase-like lactoylglutathione lyase family enzyme